MTFGHRSAYGTIKTAKAVSVRCSADRSLIDFHGPGTVRILSAESPQDVHKR